MYWVRTFRDSYINLGQVKEMRVIRDADTGIYIIMADDTALECTSETENDAYDRLRTLTCFLNKKGTVK
jgi:hypothetical protein